MMMTSNDLAQRLRVTRQTITNWCVEFAEFLSNHAKPSEGSHRRFTDDDLGVLTLVATLRNTGRSKDEIFSALAAGQRLKPDLANLAISPDSQLAALQREMVNLEDELEHWKQEADRLKTVEWQAAVERALKERAEKELAAAQEEIKCLNREIGKLEGQIDKH